jgi:hypothetical protein
VTKSTAPGKIVQHCAVSGRTEIEFLTASWDISRYARCERAVMIFFRPKSRKNRGRHIVITPAALRYAQVKVDGKVVYDTRQDVPCDMAAWREQAERMRGSAVAADEWTPWGRQQGRAKGG